MKRLFLMISAVLCIMLCGCASTEKAAPANTDSTSTPAIYSQISTDEAVSLMETEQDYIILDVRTQEEYNAGHIPGAICIPNEEIGTSDISALPDKDQLILVYCRSGRRSKEASEKLAELGYSNVKEFGGIIDWTGETVTGSGI